MKPEYKRVKVLRPHCPTCKEELSGNNSMMFPWKCKCGEWHNTPQNPLEYEILSLRDTL